MDSNSTIYQIVDMFNNVDDMLNNYIDKIELTPVQINKNTYICGFRRSNASSIEIEVHIKEIRKIKLEGFNSSLTDEGGWYLMEPDGEVWINARVLSDISLKVALVQFLKKIDTLEAFHVMVSKWKDNNDKTTNIEVSLYENKKVACKDALAMRKKHKNVSNKFEICDKEGNTIEGKTITQTEKEPSDLELITCATV